MVEMMIRCFAPHSRRWRSDGGAQRVECRLTPRGEEVFEFYLYVPSREYVPIRLASGGPVHLLAWFRFGHPVSRFSFKTSRLSVSEETGRPGAVTSEAFGCSRFVRGRHARSAKGTNADRGRDWTGRSAVTVL